MPGFFFFLYARHMIVWKKNELRPFLTWLSLFPFSLFPEPGIMSSEDELRAKRMIRIVRGWQVCTVPVPTVLKGTVGGWQVCAVPVPMVFKGVFSGSLQLHMKPGKAFDSKSSRLSNKVVKTPNFIVVCAQDWFNFKNFDFSMKRPSGKANPLCLLKQHHQLGNECKQLLWDD